jgi:quercetin dioxygenase-like cupin family protein
MPRADASTTTPRRAHQHLRWCELEVETLKGTITRKIISGDQAMVAQVFLKRGDEVPRHAHHNEQITYILSGALRFTLGSGDGEAEVIVHAGEVLVIPPDLPHAAVALEDTLDLDIFSPPREDWLARTDAYLRDG